MVDEATRKSIATLLQELAANSLDENSFRSRWSQLTQTLSDPVVDLAQDEIEDYFRNFGLTTFWGRPVKPDQGQVAIGQEALRALARAFDQNLTAPEVSKILRWI